MKRMVRNEKGFSLIELMVVVAIIGILAAIAVPNFQRFQAKSRQSEAKANLGALYSCEKAFFAEWNLYFADFRDIGFAPEGTLRYRTGFAAAGDTLPAAIGYSGPSNNDPSQATNATQFNTTVYCPASNGGNGACKESPLYASALPGTTNLSNATGNQQFVAGASGIIGTTTTADWWTINQVKDLINTQNGIQ